MSHEATPEENSMDVSTAEQVENESKRKESEEQIDPSGSNINKSIVRSRNSNKNIHIMMDVNHKRTEPSDVIEYEWPIKSGDRWFLQEQIGELLDIKSFSRKFPDLSRRKVNHEEREYLENTFNVNQLLNETQLRDMSAMRATEIHDLMSAEYSEIYKQYKMFLSQREREKELQKAREMEAIKNDAVKLAELRQKALNSASEFNKELQNSRRNERRHFWDIQTNIIQSRRSQWHILSKEATRPHPYSAALIPGQYQHYFKKFSKEELDRLPFGTILDAEHLYPINRESSPPPLTVGEEDLQRLKNTQDTPVSNN